MKNRVLITVCGRAGSKGFKNKNLKIMLGYPLVYYTLSAAESFVKKVKEDTEVDICLNTDSEELAEVVRRKYPEVFYIKRGEELAGDTVPKPAVWHNCLDIMQKKKSIIYDYIIDLDITSPLRQQDDVYNAYLLKKKRTDADLVESMCKARRNPYFNMMKEDGDYVSTVIDCAFVGRQQAPKVYDENASIYVLNADYFEMNGDMLNNAKTVPYLMRDTAVLDIDCEEDFIMMEVIAKYLFDQDENYRIIRDSIR